jgi:hypothetical protein
MNTRKYAVSMQCTIFATVEIEATTKFKAEKAALQAEYHAFTPEMHTLTQSTVDSITEIKD